MRFFTFDRFNDPNISCYFHTSSDFESEKTIISIILGSNLQISNFKGKIAHFRKLRSLPEPEQQIS